MGAHKSNFVRLSRKQLDALNTQERRAYMEALLDAVQEQITRNRELLEHHERYLKDPFS